MARFESFDEFLQEAQALVYNDPYKTRCVAKYRHSSGRISFKITNDVMCLSFEATDSSYVKKVEAVNSLFCS